MDQAILRQKITGEDGASQAIGERTEPRSLKISQSL